VRQTRGREQKGLVRHVATGPRDVELLVAAGTFFSSSITGRDLSAPPVARAAIAVHISMLATIDLMSPFGSVSDAVGIGIVQFPPAASSRRDIRQQAGPAERSVRPSHVDPSRVNPVGHGCTGYKPPTIVRDAQL